MSKIVKRKKKRKILKQFSQSFERHGNGYLYRQEGGMYIFPDFPTKDCLYFTIRVGDGFSYTKRCNYGTTIRIPKWVTDGLKRRKLQDELKLLEQIRKYVKEHNYGSNEAPPRTTPKKVRKLLRRSKETRNNTELLQESEE